MPSDDWFTEIHQRLLDGDPIALAELAACVFSDLVKKITDANQTIDPAIIQDACTEAWEKYVKNPKTFNPSERGLFGYLVMSAQGDVKNRLAKETRRRAKEIPVHNVELSVFHGNEISESEIRGQWQDIEKRLQTIFSDPADVQAARLIIDGERATSAFVDIFGLQHLAEMDQKKEVKRRKDRVKKKIQRSTDLRDE